MASIVSFKDRIIRISPNHTSLEYSGSNGISWTLLTSTSEFGRINDLLSDGEHLFAACERGFFYSDNGGHCWTIRSSSSSYGKFIGVGGSARLLFCNTDRGFFSSTDGGYTWTLKH